MAMVSLFGLAPAFAAEVFVETAELVDPDLHPGDLFGTAVALEGDTLVVGANNAEDDETDAVYVYRREPTAPNGWELVQTLVPEPPSGKSPRDYGAVLALSGDTLAVVSSDNGNGGLPDNRFVSVHERNAGGLNNWGEVAQLAVSGSVDGIALEGDTLAVGSRIDFVDEAGNLIGAVHVYERDAGGPNGWGEVAFLVSDDVPVDFSRFGEEVEMDGDHILAGAPFQDDGLGPFGVAYIFERDAGGPGAWGQVARLVRPDALEFDNFGAIRTLALQGDIAWVAAPNEDNGAGSLGAIYVYERDAGGPDAWGLVARIVQEGAAAEDNLGVPLAVEGDLLVAGFSVEEVPPVGDTVGAILYRSVAGDPSQWVEVGRAGVSEPTVRCPTLYADTPAAIDNGTLVLGAAELDVGGRATGKAFIFEPGELSVTKTGFCPTGEVTFSLATDTPSTRVGLMSGRAAGNDPVPGGPCAGVLTSLEAPTSPRVLRTDDNGNVSIPRQPPLTVCGGLWQAVRLDTCTLSNLVELERSYIAQVYARRNIFGAGHSIAPEPGGGGAGGVPFEVPIQASAGEVRFRFRGTTNFGAEDFGPDGTESSSTDVESWEGVSGIRHDGRLGFLVGVFLDSNEPMDPAPGRLDFTGADDFLSLSPALGQTFFVGDGRTGTGSGEIQRFEIPEGATRLFLGFAEAGTGGLPGGYLDNSFDELRGETTLGN